MRDPKAEWYRDWAKEQPNPWVDRVLGVVSITVLVIMVVTVLRNV